MKISEMTIKSSDELEQMLQEHQIKLGKLQFQRQAKTLTKSHELGILKRDIARIKTILHGRKQ
ncbi:MAG: 50S ribosomal protein L29 [Patescibacteria group bacterium]